MISSHPFTNSQTSTTATGSYQRISSCSWMRTKTIPKPRPLHRTEGRVNSIRGGCCSGRTSLQTGRRFTSAKNPSVTGKRGGDPSLLDPSTIIYRRKGYAVASEEQLARIEKVPKREFIRRRINEHTLEKICNREPVRAEKVAKCLKALAEYEEESRQKCTTAKG